jgi:hypothetical protein
MQFFKHPRQLKHNTKWGEQAVPAPPIRDKKMKAFSVENQQLSTRVPQAV